MMNEQTPPLRLAVSKAQERQEWLERIGLELRRARERCLRDMPWLRLWGVVIPKLVGSCQIYINMYVRCVYTCINIVLLEDSSWWCFKRFHVFLNKDFFTLKESDMVSSLTNISFK